MVQQALCASSTGTAGTIERGPLAGERLWVWMDVSGTCNLTCRDCYTKQSHEPVLVSEDQFRDTLNKFAASGASFEKLHLNWRGEPMTNKRLARMLALRNEIMPGTPIEFHTNGLLLTEKNSAAIIAQTIPEDLVYVSIDGGNREGHEGNRGEGSWEPTLAGLEMLLDARDAAAPERRPHLGIYEICYDRRSRYDETLIALSKRCASWTRVNEIKRTGDERPFNYVDAPQGPCFWVGNALCITARGDVHVCLLSFRPDGRVGNIRRDTLESIVHNAREYRERIADKGRDQIAHCRGCQKTEGTIDEPE
ncbi:radical SAM/SPASM domain-containing protein [Croceicoccus marinus]|jgi:radical SAM protein with 4Fe4S-binding SPASM domain|uniref:SPASM domain-containing protein n=1 Tax=Croceicoccus marinus TaxID=450378 RepID=A0A7G6VZI6_9SPHN|nr:radical SAM/SPASM domain-containing protein [Croceicoccus marinus]QNE07151.1 SPASM domain-containing protein [Croceicoccus marinus]